MPPIQKLHSPVRTIPKYKLSSGGSSNVVACIEYARKQSIAPNHRSIAKPPNKFWQNLTHSGVVGGGVRALGPSLSKLAFA